MIVKIIKGDCRDILKTLPDESVHCVVTSPPYWGLRDYGVAGQIGFELSFQEYIETMRAVFAEVRRVLRPDGTLWLNLGDCYAGGGRGGGNGHSKQSTNVGSLLAGLPIVAFGGAKAKDLLGMPWRVAFALQSDGWWLRSDIIWSKPNPMPESVKDRPTKAHEYIFLLSKSERYFYDAEAIKESAIEGTDLGLLRGRSFSDPANVAWHAKSIQDRQNAGIDSRTAGDGRRNKRTVWEITTAPFAEAHFATFPSALIEPCILAGCPDKCCAKCGAPWVREVERVDTGKTQKMADGWDTGSGGHGTIHRNGREKGELGKPVMRNETVGFSPSCSCNAATVPGTCLDPFGGAGTTGLVADRLGRNAILIELNPDYAAMAHRRISGDSPMFAKVESVD